MYVFLFYNHRYVTKMNNNGNKEAIIEEKGDIFDELIELLGQTDDDEGDDVDENNDKDNQNEVQDETDENDLSQNKINTSKHVEIEYNFEELLKMKDNIDTKKTTIIEKSNVNSCLTNNITHTDGVTLETNVINTDSSQNSILQNKKRKKYNKYKNSQNEHYHSMTKLDYKHKFFNAEKQKRNKEMRTNIRSDISDICQQKYKQICLDTILEDEKVIQKLNMTFENNLVTDLFEPLHQLMEDKKEECKETKMLSKYSSKYMFDIFYILSHHILLDKEKAKDIISKNPDILINFLEYKNMRKLRLNKKKKGIVKPKNTLVTQDKLYDWNTKTFSKLE